MKRLCVLLPLFFVLLSCTRDWNNPFETDSDLGHPPLITNIQLDNSNRLMLYLDYSYSSDCTLLFERKSASAFDPVNLLPVTTSVYADTTLDMEQNYNLVYRLRVQKNGYTSDYSNEKQFSYVSNVLNAPTGLTCSSIELQGVRLNWLDNSSKETGFRIEKNVNGSGFAEAADLPANTTTWLDAISGMPDPPQSIIYRIRAYNNNLNSAWTEQNAVYSGLGAPTNLHVTNSNFWELTIAWTRNSTIATGYQIERRKNGGAWAELSSVGQNASSYCDVIATTGEYDYRVCSVSDGMYSTYSNIVSVSVTSLIPGNGLVAHFPFNGNAHDESGNGNNATVYGAIQTQDRFGNNTAYSFDGVNDYLKMENSQALQWGSSSFTISLWIKLTSDIEYAYLLSKANPDGWTNNNKAFYLENSRIGFNSYGQGMYTINNPLVLDQWYHLTLLHDNEANLISIYVNGVYNPLSDPGVLYDLPADNVNDGMYFACLGLGSGLYYAGQIDDVRLYSRALSSSEIQTLYHEGGWTGAK